MEEIEANKETERAITAELKNILGQAVREGSVWDYIGKIR